MGKNGLAEFDGEQFIHYNSENSEFIHSKVKALAVDHNNHLWAGTNGGGLAEYDGINWNFFNTDNSELPSNNIYALAVDNTNNLWISTSEELLTFNAGE